VAATEPFSNHPCPTNAAPVWDALDETQRADAVIATLARLIAKAIRCRYGFPQTGEHR